MVQPSTGKVGRQHKLQWANQMRPQTNIFQCNIILAFGSAEETDRARREVRGMASLQLCLPFSSTSRSQFRFSYGRVQCSSERQELFSRIAPVYDNVS